MKQILNLRVGKTIGYKKRMKEHSWEKIIVKGKHIGQKRTKFDKTIFNPRVSR